MPLLHIFIFFSSKVYHLHAATKECLGMHLIFDDHHVFFLTPQILLNNINNKRISLSDISLLILDECHHTRKKEPYNNVMKLYITMKRRQEKLPQVVWLTYIQRVLMSNIDKIVYGCSKPT